MVITVITVTYVPTQPSMIEAWSLDDLRCKVFEKELQRSTDVLWDRPSVSSYLTDYKAPRRRRTDRNMGKVSWTIAITGALIMTSGGLWMMSIMGFEVPWYTAAPVVLMLIGSFIIASALNQRTGRAGAANDRCDH
jgi:hypothetical protein